MSGVQTKLRYRAGLHRRALSRVVNGWREAAAMSGADVAVAAGWSTAKMSMLLNAHQPMSEADFLTLAMIFKGDPLVRDRGLHSVRTASAQCGDSWGGLTWTLAELEAEAQELRVYTLATVPPLLRTPAYDDAIWSSLPAAVQQRHERYDDELRQATLAKLVERPHMRMHVVFAHHVLRRVAALDEIGGDQLSWIVNLAELDNVTFQVERDVGPPVAGGFTMLSFLEDRFEDVVYTEQLHGVEWLEPAAERLVYEEAFVQLTDGAMGGDRSLEFIAATGDRASRG